MLQELFALQAILDVRLFSVQSQAMEGAALSAPGYLGHDGACPSRFKSALGSGQVYSLIMPLEPKNIELIQDELAIRWNDDKESYLPLEFLRRACPCAACGGEPDVLGHVLRPEVNYSAESFALTGFQVVGGYALQPRWGDGHNTGIYSFQYLRRLDAADAAER